MAISGSLSTVRAQTPRHPLFDKAFAYIEDLLQPGTEANKRMLAVQPGSSHRIELGDEVYAMEQAYQTKLKEEGRWESHIKFIDIQVVVGGEEILEVAEVSRLQIDENLSPGKDLLFYKPHAQGSALRLKTGDAAVLFPVDGHLPGLRVQQGTLVRKTVVKVPVH